MATNLEPQPLSADQHGSLRIRDDARIEFAARQHVLLIRATEIGLAAAAFPVFLNRHGTSGAWLFSAMTSFIPGSNLFVRDQQWEATYLPTFLQTYPVFLVPREPGSNDLVPAISGEDSAFSTETGTALYDNNGSPSLELTQIEKALRADFEKDKQSRAFAEKLVELELHKAVDIVVSLESGQTQTIRGLHTIDEERLRTLDDATTLDLQQRGYLMAIHAMLVSMGQVNALVQRHAAASDDRIKNVRIESARDPGAAPAH
ncbi:MAG: SapC family protein [Pseudomonadota bacterium]